MRDATPDISVMDRRAQTDPSLRQLIDLVCPTLRRVVNYATHVLASGFKPADQSGSGTGDLRTSLAPFALFRHAIFLTDGIEVLLSRVCVDATAPLLRSSFEASLGLTYMLQRDQEKRAQAWLYADGRKSLSLMEKMKEHGLVPAANKEFDPTFDEALFGDLIQEYEEKRKARGYGPDWYSLNGGPRNIPRLIRCVGWGDEFYMAYQWWSSLIHASGKLGASFGTDGLYVGMNPIRNSADLLIPYGSCSIDFMIQVLDQMIRHYGIPSEQSEYLRWKADRVRPATDRIAATTVTVTRSPA